MIMWNDETKNNYIFLISNLYISKNLKQYINHVQTGHKNPHTAVPRIPEFPSSVQKKGIKLDSKYLLEFFFLSLFFFSLRKESYKNIDEFSKCPYVIFCVVFLRNFVLKWYLRFYIIY